MLGPNMPGSYEMAANPAEPCPTFPRIVTYTFVGPDELPGFDTYILPEMTQNLPGFAHT